MSYLVPGPARPMAQAWGDVAVNRLGSLRRGSRGATKCAFLNGMMFALSADRFEFAAALTSRKVRCSPSSPCSHAKGALRVAPGGSAPPILYVACRSFGGAGRDGKAGSRIEQESWHTGLCVDGRVQVTPDNDRDRRTIRH
jgi:hypothetical protein